MKIEIENKRLNDTGDDIKVFDIRTKKGVAFGFYHPIKDEIVIHHIWSLMKGKGCVKGIMEILCNNFRTRRFRITNIINLNIRNKIRGDFVSFYVCDKNSPYYRENINEIRGIWYEN